MNVAVAELAKRLDAELVGEGSGQISAVGPIETAGDGDVTFITDARHKLALEKSKAGAVIVAEPIDGSGIPQLVVRDVNAALIEVLNIFAPKLKAVPGGIDPTAKVSASAEIADGASVGPGAVIDDGAQIGENTMIAGGCKIGENSKVGKNCRLDCNVVVYHNCTIGSNVVIQANSTIGSTGFGYYFIDGAHRLIPHNGVVVIEDFVEIGANCCVDRAKFGETRIKAGTKMDNFVQIAHNVVIGRCCLIVAQVAIGGSAKIGDGVVLAGQVGVADHAEVGDGVMVGAQSVVLHNVAAGKQVFGTPAIDKMKALRISGLTRRLPKLAEQLKQLIKKVERLEAAEHNKD